MKPSSGPHLIQVQGIFTAAMETAAKTERIEILDARGLVCPMPIIRLGQAIRKVNVGEIVEMWTVDPGSQANMSAWTRNTGHELVISAFVAGVYNLGWQ